MLGAVSGKETLDERRNREAGGKSLSVYVSVKICKILTIEGAFQENEDSGIPYGLTKTQKDHAGKGRAISTQLRRRRGIYIVAKPERSTKGWQWR
jgi:hypothetical protein